MPPPRRPPWASSFTGQHVLSLLQAVTSHTERQRAEGSQDSSPEVTRAQDSLTH